MNNMDPESKQLAFHFVLCWSLCARAIAHDVLVLGALRAAYISDQEYLRLAFRFRLKFYIKRISILWSKTSNLLVIVIHLVKKMKGK